MVFFLARFTFENTHAGVVGVKGRSSGAYAKTLKVNAALQSVFLGTKLNGRRYAIGLPLC